MTGTKGGTVQEKLFPSGPLRRISAQQTTGAIGDGRTISGAPRTLGSLGARSSAPRPRPRVQRPLFDTLIASAPKDREVGKSVASSFGSLVVHGVLITAGVVATMGAADAVRQTMHVDTSLVFLTEPEPEPPEPEALRIASLNPPPKGFQTLVAPLEIPTEIPPVDVDEAFDPRNYTGEGVEGGVFSGVEGGTGPVDLTRIFEEAMVEELPERLSGPALRYPEILRRANMTGWVLLEFVIRPNGTVDGSSIRVLDSTHKGFESPAIQAVADSRFRPGKVRGTPVSVLVTQRISFSLT